MAPVPAPNPPNTRIAPLGNSPGAAGHGPTSGAAVGAGGHPTEYVRARRPSIPQVHAPHVVGGHSPPQNPRSRRPSVAQMSPPQHNRSRRPSVTPSPIPHLGGGGGGSGVHSPVVSKHSLSGSPACSPICISDAPPVEVIDVFSPRTEVAMAHAEVRAHREKQARELEEIERAKQDEANAAAVAFEAARQAESRRIDAEILRAAEEQSLREDREITEKMVAQLKEAGITREEGLSADDIAALQAERARRAAEAEREKAERRARRRSSVPNAAVHGDSQQQHHPHPHDGNRPSATRALPAVPGAGAEHPHPHPHPVAHHLSSHHSDTTPHHAAPQQHHLSSHHSDTTPHHLPLLGHHGGATTGGAGVADSSSTHAVSHGRHLGIGGVASGVGGGSSKSRSHTPVQSRLTISADQANSRRGSNSGLVPIGRSSPLPPHAIGTGGTHSPGLPASPQMQGRSPLSPMSTSPSASALVHGRTASSSSTTSSNRASLLRPSASSPALDVFSRLAGGGGGSGAGAHLAPPTAAGGGRRASITNSPTSGGGAGGNRRSNRRHTPPLVPVVSAATRSAEDALLESLALDPAFASLKDREEEATARHGHGHGAAAGRKRASLKKSKSRDRSRTTSPTAPAASLFDALVPEFAREMAHAQLAIDRSRTAVRDDTGTRSRGQSAEASPISGAGGKGTNESLAWPLLDGTGGATSPSPSSTPPLERHIEDDLCFGAFTHKLGDARRIVASAVESGQFLGQRVSEALAFISLLKEGQGAASGVGDGGSPAGGPAVGVSRAQQNRLATHVQAIFRAGFEEGMRAARDLARLEVEAAALASKAALLAAEKQQQPPAAAIESDVHSQS